MKKLHTIKYSCIHKILLVALYASFFSVQLLYNFYLTSFVAEQQSRVTFSGVFSDAKHKGLTYSQKPGKIKISFVQLNKRFQPAATPACNAIVIPVNAEYIEKSYSYIFSSEALFNVFLLTQSLRAPPAFV